MATLKNQIFNLLHKLFELPPNTLTGEEVLSDSNSNLIWSSIEVIGFIALCDEQFNVIVSTAEILKAEKVSDLVAIIEKRIGQVAEA